MVTHHHCATKYHREENVPLNGFHLTGHTSLYHIHSLYLRRNFAIAKGKKAIPLFCLPNGSMLANNVNLRLPAVAGRSGKRPHPF